MRSTGLCGGQLARVAWMLWSCGLERYQKFWTPHNLGHPWSLERGRRRCLAARQRCDETVLRSKNPRAQPKGYDGLEHLYLAGRVHLQVDLGGSLLRMPEPERHLPEVAGGPERIECARVA